jgi:phosphoribosylformylglycinamidine synthase
VSLYNESRGRDIDPTPVVGVLGLIERLDRRPPGVQLVDGDSVLLVGITTAELGGSAWAWQLHGHRGGRLPPLDLRKHRILLDFTQRLVAGGLVHGVHDVSDGGLGVALAEMAVHAGVGFELAGVDGHAALFSESPSRIVLCVDAAQRDAVAARADAAGLPIIALGRAGGDRLVIEDLVDVSLEAATRAWREKLPASLNVSG